MAAEHQAAHRVTYDVAVIIASLESEEHISATAPMEPAARSTVAGGPSVSVVGPSLTCCGLLGVPLSMSYYEI